MCLLGRAEEGKVMKDTNFVEILPMDEVEILDPETPLPKFGYRVIGLSKSRNLVTLKFQEKTGLPSKVIERPPHRVSVRLMSSDPRAGAKYPISSGDKETQHYLSVIQAFVKKRTGDFDEWKSPESGG
jgi:hypothetical protein